MRRRELPAPEFLMALLVVTPPAESPVSLVEAKAHLRLEESADDAYVTGLIDTARVYVEKECERALVRQTVKFVGPALVGIECLQLPGGRLADVPQLEVKYLDLYDVEQTLDPAKYLTVDGGEARPGELHLASSTDVWPLMSSRPDALRVQYRVGWATASAVPAPLRHAVLLKLSDLYEHRTTEPTTITNALESLMAPFRFRSI